MWSGGGGDCKKRGINTGASADKLIDDDREALFMSGEMGVVNDEGREGVVGATMVDRMGGGKVKDGEAV